MDNDWFKLLVLFGKNDIWTRKNLLHRLKDEKLIDDALSSGYIEQYDTNDIGEPRYHITELGLKIRDN
ncbi:MAG: hypothetical protein J6A38_03180 [Clostridia bacterium]|nr:hypothetical protein [Clostridia bacterium]